MRRVLGSTAVVSTSFAGVSVLSALVTERVILDGVLRRGSSAWLFSLRRVRGVECVRFEFGVGVLSKAAMKRVVAGEGLPGVVGWKSSNRCARSSSSMGGGRFSLSVWMYSGSSVGGDPLAGAAAGCASLIEMSLFCGPSSSDLNSPSLRGDGNNIRFVGFVVRSESISIGLS